MICRICNEKIRNYLKDWHMYWRPHDSNSYRYCYDTYDYDREILICYKCSRKTKKEVKGDSCGDINIPTIFQKNNMKSI